MGQFGGLDKVDRNLRYAANLISLRPRTQLIHSLLSIIKSGGKQPLPNMRI